MYSLLVFLLNKLRLLFKFVLPHCCVAATEYLSLEYPTSPISQSINGTSSTQRISFSS